MRSSKETVPLYTLTLILTHEYVGRSNDTFDLYIGVVKAWYFGKYVRSYCVKVFGIIWYIQSVVHILCKIASTKSARAQALAVFGYFGCFHKTRHLPNPAEICAIGCQSPNAHIVRSPCCQIWAWIKLTPHLVMLEESVTFEKIQTLRKQKLTLKSDLSADILSSKVSSQVKCANSNNISRQHMGRNERLDLMGRFMIMIMGRITQKSNRRRLFYCSGSPRGGFKQSLTSGEKGVGLKVIFWSFLILSSTQQSHCSYKNTYTFSN